jgi:hypothetical protein
MQKTVFFTKIIVCKLFLKVSAWLSNHAVCKKREMADLKNVKDSFCRGLSRYKEKHVPALSC